MSVTGLIPPPVVLPDVSLFSIFSMARFSMEFFSYPVGGSKDRVLSCKTYLPICCFSVGGKCYCGLGLYK